jgi:HEAT repeat protein
VYLLLAGTVCGILLVAVPARAQDKPSADLTRSIDALSAFDYPTRMNAARTVRRTPASEAIPALSRAVHTHTDQFVRYRALVLLTSFNDPGTGAIMRGLVADRNDRVREVAYRWFERHPEPALHDTLLAALNTEQAEFVRPALIRALAAHADTMAVQRALLAEAGRGFDFFRSAVIAALGEHRATYAVKTIIPITALEGPLQDDAILALGRIGDRAAIPTLSSLTMVPPEAAPALEAARCLMADKCEERIAWLAQSARAQERPAIARATVAALGVVASEGHAAATDALFDLERTTSRLRSDVAVTLATMALRRPQDTMEWLTAAPEERRTRAVELVKEGFESLEEDFAEEQFFAAARAGYWTAAEGSSTRTVAATLIDKLEF